MGAVGLVILVGVVVNNGIVYIDLVTRLRAEDAAAPRPWSRGYATAPSDPDDHADHHLPGSCRWPSVTHRCGDALRPLGPGGGRWTATTGTLLTLFLLPFLYTVLDDMRDTARNFAAHLLGSPKEAALK